MKNASGFLLWAARIIAAAIMLQTLYFKFTGSEESVYIFTTVGMEPWGRIGVGIMELIASILIIWPSLSWVGGGLAAGLMAGAIGMHLTLLGIEVKGDHGQLFLYALIVLLTSLYVVWIDREKVQSLLSRFLSR